MFQTSSEDVTVETPAGMALRVANFGRRGRGVVPQRDLRRGELIERAPVIIVPEAERAAIDSSAVGNYIFMWEHGHPGDGSYRPNGRAALVLGFASLVNHSEAPNCRFVRHIEALALDLVALRDIAAGEELTFDYGMELWFEPD